MATYDSDEHALAEASVCVGNHPRSGLDGPAFAERARRCSQVNEGHRGDLRALLAGSRNDLERLGRRRAIRRENAECALDRRGGGASREVGELRARPVLAEGHELEQVHPEVLRQDLQRADRRLDEAALQIGEVPLGAQLALVGELLERQPRLEPQLPNALADSSGQRIGCLPARHRVDGNGRVADTGSARRTIMGALRILVVDDDIGQLRTMRGLLPEFEIATVGDARSALAIIRAGARFDAILCELVMCDMGGEALHAVLSREVPDQAAVVVLVSPSGRAGLPAGAPCLAKPYTARDLRVAIVAASMVAAAHAV
jgi:CheY-like chemotaxis protein